MGEVVPYYSSPSHLVTELSAFMCRDRQKIAVEKNKTNVKNPDELSVDEAVEPAEEV